MNPVFGAPDHPGLGLALGLLIALGCAPDRVSAPVDADRAFATGDFSGKKLQLTDGRVCGGSSPKREFDQSLDEEINAVDVSGFLPFGAQWELVGGGDTPDDLGHFSFICGGFPNFYDLISDVSGRAGIDVSAGDLAQGTYTLRVVFAGKVLARTRLAVVP